MDNYRLIAEFRLLKDRSASDFIDYTGEFINHEEARTRLQALIVERMANTTTPSVLMSSNIIQLSKEDLRKAATGKQKQNNRHTS